ncbi:glycosyltransferase family 4 protein [Kocuria palustris]|uniref:glycosyltransferase family 4 protein n=1 Tax=Kocuria palustris TaxID=71999 RepID=UPI0011A43F31|nr:glycosyltransferase family 4 protein [Kocuria palustris]
MITGAVIGPGPGSAGGIGVMAANLQATSSERTALEFVESGGAAGSRPVRLAAFLRCAAGCLGPSAAQVRVFAVSSHGSTWRKLVLTALAGLRRRPYVLHLHGGGYADFLAGRGRLGRRAVRGMFRRAERVIVLGEGWARFVEDRLGVQAGRIAVLPNAVPGPKEAPRRPDSEPVRVLFAGRVGARKGAPELVEAWRRIGAGRDAVLVLAGDLDDPDGSIRAAVEAAPRVELTGWLEPAQLQEQLRRAQVLVLPSRAENLPLSLLEGMAWGLAPIATPVGAVPEVIDDGENGRLVPVGDSAALAETLRDVLDDPAARHRLAVAARRTWEAGYTLAGYRGRFDDILEQASGAAASTTGRRR